MALNAALHQCGDSPRRDPQNGLKDNERTMLNNQCGDSPPNTDSLMRLGSAICAELSDEWGSSTYNISKPWANADLQK